MWTGRRRTGDPLGDGQVVHRLELFAPLARADLGDRHARQRAVGRRMAPSRRARRHDACCLHSQSLARVDGHSVKYEKGVNDKSYLIGNLRLTGAALSQVFGSLKLPSRDVSCSRSAWHSQRGSIAVTEGLQLYGMLSVPEHEHRSKQVFVAHGSVQTALQCTPPGLSIPLYLLHRLGGWPAPLLADR